MIYLASFYYAVVNCADSQPHNTGGPEYPKQHCQWVPGRGVDFEKSVGRVLVWGVFVGGGAWVGPSKEESVAMGWLSPS